LAGIFSFFILYGGGGRGRVSPKGETDGILVPIQWTRFCQTIFWGYGFGKTETDFFSREFGFGFPRGGGVWGGIRAGLWRNPIYDIL